MSDRSPSPPVCTHPKHPITGHCVSCLIRHRKTVCCQEFPCHRHAGEPDTFWDRVAAHEVTLANRRERKKERRAQKTTPQKPGAAPPAPVVSPAKSCAGDWPREVFGAAQGQASGLTLGFQGPSAHPRRASVDSARSPSIGSSASSSKFLSPSKLGPYSSLWFCSSFSLLACFTVLWCYAYRSPLSLQMSS